MAIKNEIIFDAVLGARSAKKVIKDAENIGDKSGKAFTREFSDAAAIGKSLKSKLFNLKTSFAAIGAVIGTALIGVGFKKAIDESRDLERSLIGLKTVAGATGAGVDQATKAAIRLASDGLVPLTDVSSSLRALLVNFNGDLEKSVQVFDVFKNSAAFNRQETLSLGQAIRSASEGLRQDLSIKTDNAGITKNLSQFQKEYAASIGTTIGKLSDAQKAQAEYVGILKEGRIFQGDFNRLLLTFDGAIGAVSAQFKFLLADFGGILTRSPSVIAFLSAIAKELGKIRGEILGTGDDIFRPILTGVISVGKGINFLIKIAEQLGRIYSVIIDNIVFRFNALRGAVGSLGLVVADVLDVIGAGGGVSDRLKAFGEDATQKLKESATDLKESITGIFEPGAFSQRTEAFLEVLQAAVDNSKPILQQFTNNAKDAADDAAKALEDGAKRINKAISSALARGLSSVIQRLATNLANGKSLFSNFGNFVLATLGELAIQVGQVAIAYGITTSAIQGLSPAAAIASGAALVAIGSILKAKFGGEGGGVGELSSGSGGFAPAVGAGSETFADDIQEEKATVEVNISGDVLDSDESGSRIIQLIQNSLDSEDVQVVGGLV